MASIVLRSFSGMAPSANAKAMDPSMASYAQNLNLRFGDFRPFPVPANVATVAAGGTLYKFETSGSFITKPGTVNFVRGPIPTDTTERTYYTGDGAPKVTTIAADVRQLGVPQPGAAPAVTVNVIDEFSQDDSAAAKGKAIGQIASAIFTNLVYTYVGVANADLSPYVASAYAWEFHFAIPGTMVSGSFVPTNLAHRNLMDDSLNFFLQTVGATTTGYAPMNLRGYQTSLGSGLSAALGAIMHPINTTTPLLSTDQITAVISDLTNGLKAPDAASVNSVARLNQYKNEFVAVANTGSASAAANIAAVKDFYAKSTTVSAVDDAVHQCVNAIFNAMFTFNN